MSAVRRWNLFLLALFLAVVILVLGVGACRVGVIQDQRVALWPTFELLHLDRVEGDEPVSNLALYGGVQVAIWTLFAYFVFVGLDFIRSSESRRP
jgi:uncharacterized membrane protein (GlpM family)